MQTINMVLALDAASRIAESAPLSPNKSGRPHLARKVKFATPSRSGATPLDPAVSRQVRRQLERKRAQAQARGIR